MFLLAGVQSAQKEPDEGWQGCGVCAGVRSGAVQLWMCSAAAEQRSVLGWLVKGSRDVKVLFFPFAGWEPQRMW